MIRVYLALRISIRICVQNYFTMDAVRFNSVGSRLFSSFCSSTFIFLSSFLQLIAAEEECKAYYDLNGRVRLLISCDCISLLSFLPFSSVVAFKICRTFTFFQNLKKISHMFQSFHDSFSCPVYCCGNAFVKYCCDDPAKRNIVKHYDTLSMP